MLKVQDYRKLTLPLGQIREVIQIVKKCALGGKSNMAFSTNNMP